ncbi:FAD-dependent oxidoreductase [Gordonia sp. GONU]|uniref:NAD(P)/FAD-dependent oxidoreductase n=1 Tax=Gordonia sp. GONU TaxID=2972949 RepID=UPI0021AC08A1|nr:FAD-dependent oxidoreductase [Gordonia sp. GONU]MCR8896626.1 FAD-dependent oxidoreductase [Gordonia sp. GONU]
MTTKRDDADATATPHSIAVVGASHAAVHLADRLRTNGFAGRIALFTDEPHVPYHRPPLSKGLLKGPIDPSTLSLRAESYFDDQRIDLHRHTRVTGVRRTDDGVVLELSGENGCRTETFDRLVLATGARARRLSLPGADHPDVLVLRDLDDADLLRERATAGPVVVIGGGFIGLEVAAGLRAAGTEVTVIETADRLLARAVGSHTAAALLRAHESMGTVVLLGRRPVEIVRGDSDGGSDTDSDLGPNHIRGVRLDDGVVVPAATVIVGIGAEPRTELGEMLGLDCDGGIVVDDNCLASDGWTLAIGDCTVHGSASGRRYRLESVDNATEQANAAAAILLGAEPHIRPAPWFWSDQGAQKLQIVGLSGGHSEVVHRTDPKRPDRQVSLYFADGRLVAAECLNSPADFMTLRTALNRGHRPSPEVFADESVPIKKLLAPARA